ncbi:MAG: hypothetical protein JKY62_00805 [Desulfocapsa sp.]|nr:hypothetical protein [Desulfocapsa sp.]
MKQQLIGIILVLLVVGAIVSADTAVASSPLVMILFGSYLLWIGWYGKEKEEKRKEQPLAEPKLK